MRKFLITGGAGFIGANLVGRLLQDGGNSITVMDNLQTGCKRNVDIFSGNKNYKFIKNDIIRPAKNIGKFDVVLNLACPASPPRYYEDPVHTLETCSIGTKNILEIAKASKARFIQTSTSEIYGDPLEHPQKESYFGNVNPYCKRSCYDEGKRYAEALIFEYKHLHNLNTGVIRIFNTYGPLMDPEDGRVVTNFIKQALRDEDITIQSDGEQTRSFCYIDDQVNGIIKMIESDFEGPVNIGNPVEFTVNELADLVIKITNSKSKKINVEAALSDPKQRKPDITLAKKELGWSPKVNLEEGVKRTIAWFGEIGYGK